ncbi:uncharacterized protein LOC133914398 [Phragmites australis]|uniref:uncharacterized protein LOC133914398 n=1 Tax=Phragmites australis TaxID=29695 RepID=UPI002D77C2A3|nr:uncharacterized protein LOC133914398 [Phragmites australis]
MLPAARGGAAVAGLCHECSGIARSAEPLRLQRLGLLDSPEAAVWRAPLTQGSELKDATVVNTAAWCSVNLPLKFGDCLLLDSLCPPGKTCRRSMASWTKGWVLLEITSTVSN